MVSSLKKRTATLKMVCFEKYTPYEQTINLKIKLDPQKIT